MNGGIEKFDLKEIWSRCCGADLQSKTVSHLKDNLAIYLILVLGFMIRLYGVQFGLPGLYHADETIVVNHALAYGTGDLNPHFFRIPPLISYIIFFEFGIYYLLGTVFGFFSSIVDFQNLFLVDPTSFYLIGRITVGVIAGTVSVYFVYLLGERVFSKTVGIISALFLSLTFLHVRNSHYIYLDIMMVLFIILTYIFIFKFLETGLRRHYVLAGLFAGVATAVKYNAALLLAPLILGHLMYYLANKNSGKIRLVNKDIIFAFIFMALAFIALNPFCIIDMKFFLASFVKETHAQGGVGFLHHLKHSLFQGLGAPLFALCLVGSFYSVYKLSRKLIVFISFPLVFFLTIVNFSQPHARYVLPLIPFLLILAAWFLESTLFKEGMPTLKAKILITAVSIMVVLPSGIKSVYSDYLFSRKDTRTLAKEWIEDKIPYGSKIAIDHSFFSPRLNPGGEQLEDKLNYVLQNKSGNAKEKRIRLLLNISEERPYYNLYFLSEDKGKGTVFLFAQPVIQFDINELLDSGVEYVIVSNESSPGLNAQFYSGLRKKGKIISRFTPYKDKERSFPIEKVTRTGGPLKSKEVYARERNGEIITIYSMNSENRK